MTKFELICLWLGRGLVTVVGLFLLVTLIVALWLDYESSRWKAK